MRISSLLLSSTFMVSLLTPSLATAASSQTLLNQALAKIAVTNPSSIEGTFDVKTTSTPLFRSPSLKGSTTNLNGTFSFAQDSTDLRNTETRIGLHTFSMDDLHITSTLENPTPFAINILNHGGDTYLRVNGWDALLPSLGLDATKIPTDTLALFSNWLKTDTEREDLNLGIQQELDTMVAKKDAVLEWKSVSAKAASKKIVPFLVLKTEKQKNATDSLRLTTKVNPAFVNFAEQEEVRTAKNDKAKIADIRSSYKELRPLLNNLRLVMVVRAKGSPQLDRVEFSLTQQETNKGCAYTRTDRSGNGIESSYKCNLNVYRTKAVASGGMNLGTALVTVSAPTSYGSFQDAVAKLIETYIGALSSSSTTGE